MTSRSRPEVRARPSAPRRTDLAALALTLLCIAASRWIAVSIFEELPHLEDEFANLWQAEVMADGRIALASPSEPQSFLVPFVVDHEGVRFGKYPPGWPAALAVGAFVGFPYWVNPLLAGLATWLTYRLGSRLAGGWGGVLASLLVATSPMILMLSGTLMPHMLTVVLTLAFSLAWFDVFVPTGGVPFGPGMRGRRLRVALAGLSLGLLAITRPLTGLAVALPFGVHAVLLLVRRTRAVGRGLLGIGAGAIIVVLLLPLWHWALTGNPWVNPYTLFWPNDRIGFGPGIGVLEGGHTLGQAWINMRLSLGAWQHDLFGWPFVSWIFVPIGLWAARKRSEGWIGVGGFLSLVVCYLAYWVGSWLLGPRYFVEAVPGLAVVSAAGIVWAGEWVGSGFRAGRARRLGLAALLAVLLAVNLLGYLPRRVGGLHGLFGITHQALASFESVNPGTALVIVRRNPNWHGYGNLLTLTAPFTESDLLLAYERGPEIDPEVIALLPGLPAYSYDPAEPGILRPAR